MQLRKLKSSSLWFKQTEILQNTAQIATVIDQFVAQAITTGPSLHSTPTWNSILRAYAKSPTPIKALRIYNHFLFTNQPDKYTYPPLFKACSRLLSHSNGRELHAHVVKTGLDADIYVQNALLCLYGHVFGIRAARNLFDKMPERDIVSWNTLLGLYNNCKKSCARVLILFKRLICEDTRPDRITFVIVLSACARQVEIDCGRAVHCFVTKLGLECSINLENALLEMYTKSGDMDTALSLFNRMVSRRDALSCTIIMNGYVEMGLIDLARKIFDSVLVKDSVMWGAMIHGYVKAKRPEEALELFELMIGTGMVPDEKFMVGAISACASLSNVEFGRQVHQFINGNNICQDMFVKTALIDMYCKCGSLEEALIIFYKMSDEKDVFVWTTMIEGLANSGQGNRALGLFKQMQRQGVMPNEATFVSVLTACTHSGLITEGCQLFRAMATVYKIEPKIEHFGCLIDLLSRSGSLNPAEEFVEIMPCVDKLIAYKTLLSACVKYSEHNLGKRIANEIMKINTQDSATFVLLSNFYALTGQWSEANQLRRNMKQFDTNKKPGISAHVPGFTEKKSCI